MSVFDALERLRDHVIVCEDCGSTTTLAEMSTHPRAMVCCSAMRSKRKAILAQIDDLQSTVTGLRKGKL